MFDILEIELSDDEITAVVPKEGFFDPWILATGKWNDNGVWVDTAKWID